MFSWVLCSRCRGYKLITNAFGNYVLCPICTGAGKLCIGHLFPWEEPIDIRWLQACHPQFLPEPLISW